MKINPSFEFQFIPFILAFIVGIIYIVITNNTKEKIVKTFKVEQVRKMLKNNQILNGLTIIALQWFFLEYYKN